MRKIFKKSKGFTLVELLIVIIIIGILAGMMMLSSGAATDKAEAVKILADLRAIKMASIMRYTDLGENPPNISYNLDLHANDTTYARPINNYLDTIPAVGYRITHNVVNGPVSVGYNGAKLTAGVGTKLKSMKDTVGLYAGPPTTANINSGPNYNGGSSVYMVITK